MLDVRPGPVEEVEIACRSKFHVVVPEGLAEEDWEGAALGFALYMFGGMFVMALFTAWNKSGAGDDWGRADGEDMGGGE